MELAILGATSQIAKDLILSLSENTTYKLSLYARKVDAVNDWLAQLDIAGRVQVGDYVSFSDTSKHFDVILNFVGSGNPALTAQIGGSILDITYKFDNLALDYLTRQPACRYIFFSSGAVYGGNFSKPACDDTEAQFQINDLSTSDWYGLAKLYAETRHRSMPDLNIVDLRVFNYFSYSADISSRFLITDMLRAISEKKIFKTSSSNIYRDYAGPEQITKIIECILSSECINTAVDCYTKAPIDKFSLLEAMRAEFGMCFEIVNEVTGLNATGMKSHYYSTSTKALKLFGYYPKDTALDVVIQQSQKLIANDSNLF
jgi:nucleoside-diphosphate-sugar epimerase